MQARSAFFDAVKPPPYTPPPPGPTAQGKTAKRFAERSGHSGAPVRREFVRADLDPTGRSALERLINANQTTKGSRGGGGKGGRTRLALLLTAWWIAIRPDEQGNYTSARPARWWAEMIGLNDPGRTGARAVSTGFAELDRRGFIVLGPSREPGGPRVVQLANELDPTAPYVRPGTEKHHPQRRNDGTESHTLGYFRVPPALWTYRTVPAIGTLSGPGLAMYLLMLYYHRVDEDGKIERVWFSAKQFKERHGLSDDTRLRGITDLINHKIIDSETQQFDQAKGKEGRTYTRRLLNLRPPYTPSPKPDEDDDHGSAHESSSTPQRSSSRRTTAF